MTGDGFEQDFLSKYIVGLGYSDSQAGRVIAIYWINSSISFMDVWSTSKSI